jgi:glycine cleavage system transcriptional repressor
MMVDGNWNALAKLESALPDLQGSLGLTIISERTEGRNAEPMLIPYVVEVIALDHPGIVHNLASFFSRRQINIEDLATESYAAAHTGSPMFSVHMTIGVPPDTHIASLRDEFMDFCDSLNLDGVMEPAKR